MNLLLCLSLTAVLQAPLELEGDKPAVTPPRFELDSKSPQIGDAGGDHRPAALFAAGGRATAEFDGAPNWGVVHYSPDADGLWARAARYKLRLTDGGATYVPALGSTAPRNFPLELELASIECGGAALPLERAAAPKRAGDRVVLARGWLDEVYDLAPESVKQSFVLYELDRRGALRLRIAWRSELNPVADAPGVRFESEHGAVRIGGALLYDARGAQLETALRVDEVGLWIEAPAAFVAAAVLPLTIDPVISTLALDTTSADTQAPDVAFEAGSNHWRIVCEHHFSAADFDVWSFARELDGSVIANSGVFVDVSSERWAAPRIAAHRVAQQFLTVAEVGPIGARRIKGRTIDANATLSASFWIDNNEVGDKSRPDVGGDCVLAPPTYYCVAWQRAYNVADFDIHARMMNADGTPLGATILVDNSAGTLDSNVSISDTDGNPPFATQAWTLVWERYGAATSRSLHVAQLGWNGVVKTASQLLFDTVHELRNPSVSSLLDSIDGSPRRYGVAAEFLNNGRQDLYCVLADGATRVVTTLVGESTSNPDRIQKAPAAISDGYRLTYVYGNETSPGSGVFETRARHVAYAPNSPFLDMVIQSEVLATGVVTSGRYAAAATRDAGATDGSMLAVWDEFVGSQHDLRGVLFRSSAEMPILAYCKDHSQCPCPQASSAYSGCPNSVAALGAKLGRLSGSSSVANDTLKLYVQSVPSTATCLLFVGLSPMGGSLTTPQHMGDGLLCIASPTKRIAARPAVGGWVTFGGIGDSPLSIDSLVYASGGVRYYQVWYRDPAPHCTSKTTNLTNGLRVIWTP